MLLTIGTHPKEPKSFSNTAFLHTPLREVTTIIIDIIRNERWKMLITKQKCYLLDRLTPVYAIVIGFYCTMFIKIGSGPLWNEKVGSEVERCHESWWTNILYINNYIKPQKLVSAQISKTVVGNHFRIFRNTLRDNFF